MLGFSLPIKENYVWIILQVYLKNDNTGIFLIGDFSQTWIQVKSVNCHCLSLVAKNDILDFWNSIVFSFLSSWWIYGWLVLLITPHVLRCMLCKLSVLSFFLISEVNNKQPIDIILWGQNYKRISYKNRRCHLLTDCNAKSPAKFKIANMGPQNDGWGLERCLPWGFLIQALL